MAEIQEPYPEGIVVGPCICGSWPGGKCLKCPRTAPLTRITWDERGVRTVNGIPDDAPQQQVGPVEDMLLRRAVLRSAKIVSDGRFVTKQAALEQPPLPVQRQPLSEKQVHKIWRSLTEGEGIEEFARAIEAAHNIGAKP